MVFISRILAGSTTLHTKPTKSDNDPDPYSVSILPKWRNLGLLALAALLAKGLWFSGSAVIPQLTVEWGLSDAQRAWMTMSVQAGFVLGAMLSAILNLADRISAHYLFAASVMVGAAANSAIAILDNSVGFAFLMRFLTGMAIAGVYPPAMKLVATWCREDRGLGIGLLVGALTLGSAMPHLLNGFPLAGANGMPPWRSVLVAISALAIVSGVIALFLIRTGPFTEPSPPFNWRFAGDVFKHKPTRLANFGYLGHMWELYAMWTWVPIFLMLTYERAEWNLQYARLAGFGVIAIGSIGCLMAGKLADRIGRTTVTTLSLVVSGACALSVGFFLTTPGPLTLLCLIWGFTVVADSAQFSAAVSELTDPRYVGTALTVQTCLGFLLTLFSIRIIQPLAEIFGWEYAFAILSLGPAFGIWSMLSLRRLPEASRMASGKR